VRLPANHVDRFRSSKERSLAVRAAIWSVRIFLLTLASCGSHSGQTIDDYLSGLAARGALTGAVLVSRGDAVLARRAYGLANEELLIQNTVETRFRIGSITKQFTAMAILILQERGSLNVRDPVCNYVSSCPTAWGEITLFHLLTHTSGIPDYTNFDDFSSLLGRPVTLEDLIDRFRTRPLDFAPGARWSYSNSGYVLLGAAVEKVSGRSYADFLEENIFGPLGMHNTGYDVNDPPVSIHATGYLSPGVKPVYFDMSEVYAAGALYSTVDDLYLWDRALLSGQLISKASLEAMTSAQVPCPPSGCALSTDRGYGYGWFIADQRGHSYVYHWGHIDGYKSSNGLYFREQVCVVVLNNLETTDVFEISTRLGDLAL
jgi:CubicO group peptidase (beta-lactamase class C family)